MGYSIVILLAALPVAFGADALSLTNVSMVVTAASLPFSTIPLLVLMNDHAILRTYCNGKIANGALIVVVLMSLVLLFVAIPLQVAGGG